MFRRKRKITIEDFSQELVLFSINLLSISAVERVKLWNAANEYGADPSTSFYELLFLRGVSVWYALFTARTRGHLR